VSERPNDGDSPGQIRVGLTRRQGSIIIAVLVAMLIILSLDTLYRLNRIPRWEYKIESIQDFEFSTKMERFGAVGWELTVARRAIGDSSLGDEKGVYECIFRRPK